MDLFDKNGDLDVERLEQQPFMVLVGARRIGKTYGVLQKMLRENRYFIYMRRTSSEIEFAANEKTSPFNVFKPDFWIGTEHDSKYTYTFGDVEIDTDTEKRTITPRGIMVALTAVAKIRGFDGSKFTDIVYDEFIPERHVNKINGEGDALLNAYETINSNRELDGLPPVRLWLLANANNLDSPILVSLGIREKMEQMRRKNQQYSVMRERGITILNVSESPISERKSATTLYKAISPDSQFSSMALHNAFSYNDFSNIDSKRLVEYIPRCRIGNYVVFDHKSEQGNVHIANVKTAVSKQYPMKDNGIRAFRVANSDLLWCYMYGQLTFDSYETKIEMSKVLPFLEECT